MSGREFSAAAVLFSGGTDSSYCAVKTLDMADRIDLLTFQPGFIFFLDNARKGAARLIDRYGSQRVRHRIISIDEINKRFLLNRYRELLSHYGFNMTSLVCLGCRLSMHAAALAYCLEQQIPLLTDGSIRKQADIPEQMEEVLTSNRAHYLKHYGIHSRSPIYEEKRSDLRLWEMELSPRQNLKGQYIFFETQATCPFGVTADVYARIFYGSAMGDERLNNSLRFLQESQPIVESAIRISLEEQGLNLKTQVSFLKSGEAPLPWDENSIDVLPPSADGFIPVSLRFFGRYIVAIIMIPVGVILGLGGLFQRWYAKRQQQ